MEFHLSKEEALSLSYSELRAYYKQLALREERQDRRNYESVALILATICGDKRELNRKDFLKKENKQMSDEQLYGAFKLMYS